MKDSILAKPLVVAIAMIAVLCLIGKDARSQWQQTNGPYVSYANSFAAIDSSYFASTNDGVYRSDDGGYHWNRLPFDYQGIPFRFLTTIGKTLFLATEDEVHSSTDKGSTWKFLKYIYPKGYRNILAFASSENNLYLGISDGVLLSRDMGITWDTISRQIEPAVGIGTIGNFVELNNDRIFVSNGSNVYQSNDTGKSWRKIVSKFYNSALGVKDSNLYLGVIGQGIFHYKQRDSNWIEVGVSLDSVNINSIAFFDTKVFCGTNNGLYISLDSGSHWKKNDSTLLTSSIYSIFVNRTIIFVGSSDGVFISVDSGKHFSQVVMDVPKASIWNFVKDDQFLFADTYRSSDEGAHWDQPQGLIKKVEIPGICKMGDSIYAVTFSGKLFISGNHGMSWDTITTNRYIEQTTTLASVGNVLLGGSYRYSVGRSTDYGITWNGTNNLYPTYFFSVSGTTTFSGGGEYDLHRSTDLGMTWENITDALGSDIVNAIAADSPYVYAGTYFGIARSSDNGNSFTTFKSPIFPQEFHSIVIDGKNVIAASDSGVFISNDRAETWRKANDGFPPGHSVYSLIKVGNMLYAGGNGVWKRPIEELGVSAEHTISLTGLATYPNPALNLITATFTLPERGLTRVSVFDLLGNEIDVLNNSTLEAGKHSFTWNAKSSPAGTYYITLHTESLNEQAPVVVVR